MAIKIENNQISLTVRDIVAINKKYRKMLSSFPLPQRGMLGQKAHARVQQQKNKSFGLFHHEYGVSGEFSLGEYNFHISGRIDGAYELKNRIEIEEIKSVILSPADFQQFQLHLYPEFSEQVLFYSYLLHKERKGIEIIPYLKLINLANDKTRTFSINFSPLVVEKLLFQRFQVILDDLLRDEKISDERKKHFKSIRLPLDEHRPQQEKMMETIRSCLSQEAHVLVSAPTGTGKTAAALYPSLEFAIEQKKKIIFVTSKTTQQKIVEETLTPLCKGSLDLNVLFLRAVRKMCPNDIFFCHEDHCPFAKHYQERLLKSNILAQIIAKKIMHPDTIIDLAKHYTLCPAEIMLDLTVYSDIIVGDYNYVFDPAVYLKRLFLNQDYSDWILIIDEAHNLYQRGIEYYSPAIRRAEILELIGFHKKNKSKVYKDLIAPLERFKELFYTIHEDGALHHEHQQYFEPHLNKQDWQSAFNDYETAFIKYLIYKLKKKLLYPDDPFESLFYSLRHFVTVLNMEGPMYVLHYNAGAGGILKIQCCDPSQHLANRISGFHSVIAMSATLDPIDYYRDILGFTVDRTKTLQLDSPFPTENRKLIIIPTLSTRYKNRNQLYPQYAEIVKKIIKLKKGNYIAFLPSFEFLQNINLFLGSIHSEKITQRVRMTESERDTVLESLRDSSEPKLLLAVLGGIFSEGVDFSGDMCIGIIIFSPGLPQINYERELIRRYYDNKNGNGFDYAYLFPGINKVIQATGRLIRSYQDKGIVVLVGERFGQERVNALFPEYWFQKPGDIVFTDSYQKIVKEFWDQVDEK